jgi:hypothetical protein
LRYPEPTSEARMLPYAIRDLADDTNSAFVVQDNRFTGLDTKTNATNNNLSLRGNPAWQYGRSAGVFTHSPNDGVNRTISQHTDMFYVHPSANYIQVSLMQASFGGGIGGTALVWEPLVNFGGTGWVHVTGNSHRTHNNSTRELDLGFHVVGIFNAQPYRNMAGSVATNCANDATSAGWAYHGFLLWSVVSFT